MTAKVANPDDDRDYAVDSEIVQCLKLEKPTSFFLFAGAGSGKTRSLVKALEAVRDAYGETLRFNGRKVGVITYTNNACDEIKRRLDYIPILSVSTIHSFVWDLIQGFNADIRTWLKDSLTAEIAELRSEEEKGRAGTKASAERLGSIASKTARLENLPRIKKFIYSPTGDNPSRNSLNHSEVIKIGASFISSKASMQKLLVTNFPILLIDESQDTAKNLIEALFVAQTTFKNQFCLGLFGDTMQRIYADGKVDLGQNLPNDWKRPAKIMNHRCPKRVVRLINKIREEADGIQQQPRSTASDGIVRLFTINSKAGEKRTVESEAKSKMAEITGDADWNKPEGVKNLILEHQMAAQRLGFVEMFQHLGSVDYFLTGLRDGTLPLVHFFSGIIFPLVLASRTGNKFAAATIVRNNSPLLSAEMFKRAGNDQLQLLKTAKAAVDKLMLLFAEGKSPSFLEVLNCIHATGLFEIPESLKAFTAAAPAPNAEPEAIPETDSASKSLEAVRNFLNTNFSQIEPYAAYVSGKTQFTTHQGVKGLEFPRVLIIMDDAASGGFLFSYEKLFGAKEKTPNDIKNERERKETSIDRTRRLFYVTCSRAQSSLAIVAYTSDPAKVREVAISKGWFEAGEIVAL